METKKLENVVVYFHQVETTLNDLGQYVGNLPMQVMEEVTKKGLKITGPQIWNYNDVNGDPNAKFKLDVCMPIDEAQVNGDGDANIKELEGFTCVTSKVTGSWDNLKDAYDELIGKMQKEGLQPASYCREIYHVVDMDNPANNITEIQLGATA